MDYELCKKLKDAGFTQKHTDGRVALVNSSNSDYCFAPTLSELIESISKERPFRLTYLNGAAVWEACILELETVFAKTPEEAVANLWLELNSK